jgi:hypothetical protein
MMQTPEPNQRSLAPSPAQVAAEVHDSAQQPGTASGFRGDDHAPQWLVRGEFYLRILLRMYIGVAVAIVPWFKVFWDQNPLFLHYPTLAAMAFSGAARGVVTGIGLLNVWIALEQAIRHDSRKPERRP